MRECIDAEEFFALVQANAWEHELVNGEIVAVPPKSQHERGLAFSAAFWIESYLQERSVGKTFQPSGFIQLSSRPTTLRRPSVAFLSLHQLAQLQPDTKGALPFAPEMIVEVVHEPKHWHYADAKIHDFLRAGTHMVWAIDASSEWIAVYRPKKKPELYRNNDKLPGGSVLPHVNIRVFEIFEG